MTPILPGQPPESPELDPQLRALFAMAASPAIADDGFSKRVMQRLQRRRRWRLATHIVAAAVIAGGAGLALALSPVLAGLGRTVALLPLRAAQETAPLGTWFLTPAGWLVSMLVGAGVLWRLKAIRR